MCREKSYVPVALTRPEATGIQEREPLLPHSAFIPRTFYVPVTTLNWAWSALEFLRSLPTPMKLDPYYFTCLKISILPKAASDKHPILVDI